MTEFVAQQTLAKMRFDLSISRPGTAINEKMALEMAIEALGGSRREESKSEQSNLDGSLNP